MGLTLKGIIFEEDSLFLSESFTDFEIAILFVVFLSELLKFLDYIKVIAVEHKDCYGRYPYFFYL